MPNTKLRELMKNFSFEVTGERLRKMSQRFDETAKRMKVARQQVEQFEEDIRVMKQLTDDFFVRLDNFRQWVGENDAG